MHVTVVPPCDLRICSHACRWSLIAGHLPGRTDNEVKNYWNSHLSRQIHTYRRKYTAGPDTTVTIDMSKLHSADKRRGGRSPGRSPRSSVSGSKSKKSKQPDPEPEAESGHEKGASSPATVTIDMSKLRNDEKWRGGRTPGRSPKSTSSSSKTKSKQPDPEPEPESGDAKGASSPATAATSASSSPLHSDGARSAVVDVDPDPNQPNSSSGSTGEGPCSEDATGPWVLDPIELRDLWQAESEIDALVSIGAGHDSVTQGFHAVSGEAQVDDLFDMDWDGLAAHLWGEPEQIDESAQLLPYLP
jgi:myb proto-oncogene protein